MQTRTHIYLLVVLLATWFAGGTLCANSVCGLPIGSGTDAAFITLETLADGSWTVTLAPANTGSSGETSFRGQGMKDTGWQYNNQPITTYFQREYASADHQQTIHFLPLPGVTIPAGGTITWNRLNGSYIEWRTPSNTNAYSDQYHFTYTYGEVCPMLDTPEHLAVTADGVVTFDSVEGAESYLITIYRNGALITTETLASGDTIRYTPQVRDTYYITVSAHATGAISSEESAPVRWLAHISTEQAVLSRSEYCHQSFTGTGATRMAYMTWETVNGDIEIRIGGQDSDEGYAWRANGLGNIANFRIGNTAASAYFALDYQAGKQTYALRLRDRHMQPALGETVYYTGTVEWVTPTDNNAYAQNRSYTYTYGSNCDEILPQLETPMVVDIDSLDIITIQEVKNAETYQLRITDEEDFELLLAPVADGDTIMRRSVFYDGFTYLVYLRSLPNTAAAEWSASMWSTAYRWQPSVHDDEQPRQDEGIQSLYPEAKARKVLTANGLLIEIGHTRYNILGIKQ